MRANLAVGFLFGALVVAPAIAQQTHDPTQHHSPYADQERSVVAALSQQEVEELESGAGMGLARAAELNHFPGPLHVLELSEELELTSEQLEKVRAIHAKMLTAAKSLGARILDEEKALDRRFSHRHIDPASLEAMTSEIAELEGRLRFVHLSAHLETTDLLTADQIARYDRLRGYPSASAP